MNRNCEFLGIGIGPPLLEGGFCLSAAAERPTRPTSLFKGTAAGRQLRLVRQQFPVVAATRGATVLSPTASYTSDGGVSHQPGRCKIHSGGSGTWFG